MREPSDMFDPSHYEDVRRPFLEASALPSWCYTSPTFYQRELEKVFLPNWNFVGREDEIPEPGDYLALSMYGEAIFLVRGKDGEIRAFSNTCRHRGTRLLSGKGNCRAVVCPYHGWTYSFEGKLVGARGMEKSIDFDKGEHNLLPLHVDSWAGFLFVHFREPEMTLLEQLGNLPEKFGPYRFEEVVCVRRHEYDLKTNWKAYIENAMEDYHTPTVHRSSIGLQECDREDAVGYWDAIHMESPRSSAVLPTEEPPFPQITNLSGRPANGTYFTILYPGTFFATTQDCMWWLQSFPEGPGRTRIGVGSCFPRSTVERPDFAEGVKRYYHRWDTSLGEDNAISEEQQVGLESQLSNPGRLSVHEPIVHAIANFVLDRVLEEKAHA